jgi:hypothetical protein
MPGMLSDLINNPYSTNYQGREQLISQLAGRGAAPPPALNLNVPNPAASAISGQQNTSWQKDIRDDVKEKKKKENIQKALAEIIDTRTKSGKPFLGSTQRLGILMKHVDPQTADVLNSRIDAEQVKAEPKYLLVTRPTPEGGTQTSYETEEYARKNPVITPVERKEKLLRQIESGERKIEDLNAFEKLTLGIKTEKPEDTTLWKSFDRYKKENPDSKLSIFEYNKKLYKGGEGKNPTEVELENQPWGKLPAKIRNKYISEYDKIVAAGDIDLEGQGIADAEDWAYQTGRFAPPESYTPLTDIKDQMLEILKNDPRYPTPEEKEAAASEVAKQARRKYGKIGTYDKWLTDLKKKASSSGQQEEVTQPLSGSKQAPKKVSGEKPKEKIEMVSTLDELDSKIPDAGYSGGYKKTYGWEGRSKNLAERISDFTGQTQTTQDPKIIRKGEDEVTAALRQKGFSGESLYDRNNLKAKLKHIYGKQMSDKEIAQAILSGELLGGK